MESPEIKNLSKKELEHRILELTVNIYRNKKKLTELKNAYTLLGQEIKQLQDENFDYGERRNQLTSDFLALSMKEVLSDDKQTP